MNKKSENNRKNTCIDLLNAFSEKELDGLRHLASCSYFNTDKTIVALLDIIKRDVWRKRQFNVELEGIIYNKLFNKKSKKNGLSALEKKQLSTKMSVLTRLAEQFLKLEALNENNAYGGDLLLQKILEKQQFSLFQRHINKNKKQLEAQLYKDFEHHRHQQFIEENTLNYLHRSGELMNRDNLNELMYHTDIQYFLKKLSLYMSALTLQNLTLRQYDMTSVGLMFLMLDLPQYASHPLVQIYRATIDLIKNGTDKNYHKLLKILHHNEAAIPRGDLNGFYIAATNFCAQQIREGKLGYKEAFELYRIMDEKDLLIEGNYIPIGKFKNTITAGCRVGQFAWASVLTEKYKNAVKKPIRESVYHFNMGAIAFYQGDYKRALHHLVRVEHINLTYNIDCRNMIIKSHYETDQEYDERTLQIFRSTEKYFNENKELTPRNKKAYKNFIRMLINIYRVRHRATKMKLENIKDKLERQEVNSDKKWLMEKIEELDGGR